MNKSEIQENLVSLYLRLNGFFVTGFIVHSPTWGRNQTEVDMLAVRFPYNAEPERDVPPSPYLGVSNEQIDLLICEVKGKGPPVQFNDALRESSCALASILRWAGMFSENELQGLAMGLAERMQTSENPQTTAPAVYGPRNTRIRCVLFSPERTRKRANQPWFVHGEEIMGYVHRCLAPSQPRDSCSTAYDFGLWGERFEPLVRYFKDRCPSDPGTIKDLYKHLEETSLEAVNPSND